MAIKIVKNPIKREELLKIASEEFGDIVKAAVDTENVIMVIGSELHADAEALLIEKEESKRENIWGINIYPKKSDNEWIEFDSMINIKPAQGNRSRDIENSEIKERIRQIARSLIID